jgi:hypothetical protein
MDSDMKRSYRHNIFKMHDAQEVIKDFLEGK